MSESNNSSSRNILRLTLLMLLLAAPIIGSLISFFEVVRNDVGGIEGLDGINDLVLTESGLLLTVSGNDDSLVSFDASQDGLSLLERFEDSSAGVFGLLGASGVAVSPDQRHVYVTAASDDTLAPFVLDATADELTFLPAYVQENSVGGVAGLDGASAVAVSPDDEIVVVAAKEDHAVSVFARDATQDGLTFTGAVYGTVSIPLRGASDIAFSPDSRHVYVAAEVDDALLLFERSGDGTSLGFVSALQDGIDLPGLDGASSVVVSPDGAHVYVAAKIDKTLSVFQRDSVTGALTWLTTYYDAGVGGLNGPTSLAMTPSGRVLLAASRYGNSVAVFIRNDTTGVLALDSVAVDGVGGVDGLGGAIAVATTEERVYAAGHDDDAVSSFNLVVPFFSDGFESGDTSAWTSNVPLN